MNLKKGDQIFVVDDDLKGEVISFTNNKVTFLSDDGFDYTLPIDKIYFLNTEGEVENITIKKDFISNQVPIIKSKSTFSLNFDLKNPVVDLHIERLDRSKCDLPDYEILQFQMEVVREIIFIANRKRIRRIVLVHGVGKGKLRKTIRNYLKESHSEIEYLDGNYQKYGGGATELIIHQFS